MQGKGRSSALGREKLVHALISLIFRLSLETGNLPFPMKAFCPCAALQVHQGKLPVTEFQAQPAQADTVSLESAPCKPCTSQFLHPGLPPFPTRQSISSTALYVTHFCIQSIRFCLKAHNAAVILDDQRLPYPPTGITKTTRILERGRWKRCSGQRTVQCIPL